MLFSKGGVFAFGISAPRQRDLLTVERDAFFKGGICIWNQRSASRAMNK